MRIETKLYIPKDELRRLPDSQLKHKLIESLLREIASSGLVEIAEQEDLVTDSRVLKATLYLVSAEEHEELQRKAALYEESRKPPTLLR